MGTPKTELGTGCIATGRIATGRTAAAGKGSAGKSAAGNRGSVRIIGGKWRGRRIAFPDLDGLRPTPDRVRETLFNWLQHSIGDARCLDLFAGSGALGLEALSRGAREVVFVDQAPAVTRNLQLQLQRLEGSAQARVVDMGAARFLGGAPTAFDVVFMDPPFGQNALPHYVALLDAGGWVVEGSRVYLECEKGAGTPSLPAHWELLKSKSAGEVGYHLARIKGRNKANE